MKQKTFLRFAGRLWEDMTFKPSTGWETERIGKVPQQNQAYQLELLKNDGTVLVSTAPQVGNIICRTLNDRMKSEKVIGYIALHAEADLIRFRKGDVAIYEAAVSKEPPVVTIRSFELQQDETIKIDWTSVHAKPLTFHMRYLDGNKTVHIIANNWTSQEMTIDTKLLPGGKECHVVIIASDGLRSSHVMSEAFKISQKPNQICIVSPSENEVLQPDQPFSLIGQALDSASNSLPDDLLRWEVNEQIIARGQRVVLAPILEPGEHTITLVHGNEDELIKKTIRVQVLERTAEQEKWREMFAHKR